MIACARNLDGEQLDVRMLASCDRTWKENQWSLSVSLSMYIYIHVYMYIYIRLEARVSVAHLQQHLMSSRLTLLVSGKQQVM